MIQDEINKVAGEEEQIKDYENPINGGATYYEEQPKQSIKERFPWLFAQSADEPIENYINHPMNFAKSEGLAQMLRGLSAIIGELRYAVIDVIIGFMKFTKENKPTPAATPRKSTVSRVEMERDFYADQEKA
jgi:hypothetical protein